MRLAFLCCFLFSYVSFFAQEHSKYSFYLSLDRMAINGSLGRDSSLTDGFSKSGGGNISLGFRLAINYKWGITAAFTDWDIKNDLGNAITLLRNEYVQNTSYQLENRSVLNSSSAFNDSWQFIVPKIGMYRSFELDKGSVQLELLGGYMITIAEDASFFLSNQNREIKVEEAQVLYTLETNDGFTAYNYTQINSGFLIEAHCQYHYTLPKTKWLKLFAGVGLQVGSFAYEYTSFIEDTATPSNNKNEKLTERVGFFNPKFQLGLGINIIQVNEEDRPGFWSK